MIQRALFITGATGYLGSNLVEKLSAHQVPLVCLVRPGSEGKMDPRLRDQISWVSSEMSAEDLSKVLMASNIHAVLHLATHFVAEHRLADLPLLMEGNLQLGTRVAEAACIAGITNFLNIGTFWQHFEGRAYSPASLYAATKQAFEDILRYYAEVRGLNVINLKFAAVYGPADPRKKIMDLLIRSAQTGLALELSPGDQRVDLIEIRDALDAVIRGMELVGTDREGASFQTYSVSSKQQLTLKQLVQTVEKITGRKIPVKWAARPYRKREFFTDWTFDPALPDWRAQVSLEEGITTILKQEYSPDDQRNRGLHSSL